MGMGVGQPMDYPCSALGAPRNRQDQEAGRQYTPSSEDGGPKAQPREAARDDVRQARVGEAVQEKVGSREGEAAWKVEEEVREWKRSARKSRRQQRRRSE